MQANFPNLRRLFIEARSDDEERQVSRKAVGHDMAELLNPPHRSHCASSTMLCSSWDPSRSSV